MEKLNAVNLKKALWETLTGLKGGKIQYTDADAIASQAREIIRTSHRFTGVLQKVRVGCRARRAAAIRPAWLRTVRPGGYRAVDRARP